MKTLVMTTIFVVTVVIMLLVVISRKTLPIMK